MRSRRIATVLLVLGAVALFTSCKSYRYRFFGKEVTKPEAGTPEHIVQLALLAALHSDPQKAWTSFVETLHSRERASGGSITTCRRTYWPAFRRKVRYLVQDPTAAIFTLRDHKESEDGTSQKLYLENSQSDQPTPIPVVRDPAQGNSWRIGQCSL